MSITYKIVRATRLTGQIEVAYFDGEKHLGTWAIDVPVQDGQFLTGDALDAEIMHRAPTWAVEREQAVVAASGFDQIEAMVQALPQPTVDPETEANAQMWEQVRFEQQVAKALVKFGVLQSDPTEIPVTQL